MPLMAEEISTPAGCWACSSASSSMSRDCVQRGHTNFGWLPPGHGVRQFACDLVELDGSAQFNIVINRVPLVNNVIHLPEFADGAVDFRN